MRRHLWAILPLAFSLSGCHVVERAKQCGKLSQAMKEASGDIKANPIKDSPTSRDLRKKARLYGQLGQRLKKTPIRALEVNEQKLALISNLEELEKQLNQAADSVEAHAEYEKRYKLSPPPTGGPLPSTGSPKPTSLGDTKAEPPSPAAKEHAPPPSSTAPTAHLRRGPRVPPNRMEIVRATVHSRQYQRAVHAAEGASGGLRVAIDRLEKACR